MHFKYTFTGTQNFHKPLHFCCKVKMHFFSWLCLLHCVQGWENPNPANTKHTLHTHLFPWQQDEKGNELPVTGISHIDYYVLLEDILL